MCIYMYIYIYIFDAPQICISVFGQVHSHGLLTWFYGMSFFYILEVLITDNSFVICVYIYVYECASIFTYAIYT